MNIFSIFILAFALAIDSSIAAFTQGNFVRTNHLREAIKISLFFSIFQGAMPVLGWVGAQQFYDLVKDYDHWLAFILFLYLGLKLINDSYKTNSKVRILNFSRIVLLSVATSVDSLVAGMTLSFLNINIILPSIYIGVVTFISSFGGFWLGHKVKNLDSRK